MMNFLTDYAGIIVSLFFFLLFVCIACWAYWPGNKTRFQKDAKIPLKEKENE